MREGAGVLKRTRTGEVIGRWGEGWQGGRKG